MVPKFLFYFLYSKFNKFIKLIHKITQLPYYSNVNQSLVIAMMIPILEAVLTQGRQWVDEVSRFLEFAGGIDEVLIKGEHRGGGYQNPQIVCSFSIKVSYVKCSFILELTFQILISRK